MRHVLIPCTEPLSGQVVVPMNKGFEQATTVAAPTPTPTTNVNDTVHMLQESYPVTDWHSTTSTTTAAATLAPSAETEAPTETPQAETEPPATAVVESQPEQAQPEDPKPSPASPSPLGQMESIPLDTTVTMEQVDLSTPENIPTEDESAETTA